MNDTSLFLVFRFSFFDLSLLPSSATELVRDHREAVTGGDKSLEGAGVER
jgi:hypothetical protein